VQILKLVRKKIPPFVTGSLETTAGRAPVIATDWSGADFQGMIKSRISAFRMNYSVLPGLYAVGTPDGNSDVFVSANYKLSFDILRRSLKGMHAWVLVLDTNSINVWCAAGKGTMGTEELIKRITAARLDAVVVHKRIILPQLSAVGICASAVQKQTGFRVSFGPVEARDIPDYVRAGYKKTEKMRIIQFPMLDRMVLTPMELNPAMKKFPWFAGGTLIWAGLQPSGILFTDAWTKGLPIIMLLLISVFSGAFVTPVLLPFIPFRSFAIKGWITGMLLLMLSVQAFGILEHADVFLLSAVYLFLPMLSSYLALQFTGATTYTGMSGVKKELKIAVPIYISASTIAGLMMIGIKLREWGLV